MSNSAFESDENDINELINAYQNLKIGKSHYFLDEDSFEKIIQFYDEKENLKEAFTAVEIGLEQFPYSSLLMIKKADILVALQRFEEALTIVEHAELYDKNDIDIYILKIEIYLAMEKQVEANEVFISSINTLSGEDKTEFLLEVADIFDDYEEFEKVFDCLKLIVEDNPTNEEALYKICFWTDFTGRFEESIKIHTAIIDEYPYNEIAWFNLAAAYQGLKLYEKAVDAYQYAVVINEKFDYAYRNMGDAYLRLRKYKEAIEVLEKVSELSMPEDVIFEAIGHCHQRLGNNTQARSFYKKASHLNPEDSKLYYKIAVTYMADSQWQNAIKFLENAMSIHNYSVEYNLAMGECKMQMHQFKDACFFFGKIVSKRSKNVQGWEALIRCLFKAGLNQEAYEQCKLALNHLGPKPLLIYYSSALLYALGKTKQSIAELETALRLNVKLLKKMIDLNPEILRNPLFVDLIGNYKKSNNKKK